jgi:MFS family permease
MGFGPIVPIVFGAAADFKPEAIGVMVGRVVTLGYVGSVAGPIAIGWLPEAASLRLTLGLVVVLARPPPLRRPASPRTCRGAPRRAARERCRPECRPRRR